MSVTLARGSNEPVIAHLVFNLTSKVYRKWGVSQIVLKVPQPDHFSTNFKHKI